MKKKYVYRYWKYDGTHSAGHDSPPSVDTISPVVGDGLEEALTLIEGESAVIGGRKVALIKKTEKADGFGRKITRTFEVE